MIGTLLPQIGRLTHSLAERIPAPVLQTATAFLSLSRSNFEANRSHNWLSRERYCQCMHVSPEPKSPKAPRRSAATEQCSCNGAKLARRLAKAHDRGPRSGTSASSDEPWRLASQLE